MVPITAKELKIHVRVEVMEECVKACDVATSVESIGAKMPSSLRTVIRIGSKAVIMLIRARLF
jgi:hypothetical protein